jgi:hypothetical protein
MKQKFATEMDYEEFINWAIEYVVSSFLESGLKGIRSGITMVVHQCAMNEVFGGKKKN